MLPTPACGVPDCERPAGRGEWCRRHRNLRAAGVILIMAAAASLGPVLAASLFVRR